MRVVLFLSIFTVCLSQSEDTACDAGYQCQDTSDCQPYNDEKEKLKQYSRGSSEYKRVLNKLKSQICNKKLRKVCCEIEDPVEDRDSPSWIPSAGECGLSGDPAFILGGADAKLGEFPWMALLGVERRGIVKWTCGGTLINRW